MRAMKDSHMIQVLPVVYCLVVEVEEDYKVEEEQVIQVEPQVVLEVEPFCFMQRRSSSME